MNKLVVALLVPLLLCHAFSFAADSLKIKHPLSRIVYQRNLLNKATIKVNGEVPGGTTVVQARLVPRKKGQGNGTPWIDFAILGENNFSGTITAEAGWYDLEVCARTRPGKKQIVVVDRVGIGEVFIVAGHSVAQGGDIDIEGSNDDRVNTVRFDEDSDSAKQYMQNGDPRYLPVPGFTRADSGVAHAPFGHSNYFWSKFGEHVAAKHNVPVLIYNAGFGGTSLEHWAKSAKSLPFEHGFVKSSIRMPYINVANTLKKYIPLTGIRAILADQGQNDAGQKSADTIFKNYYIFIQEARKDLDFSKLALVVNRQMPANSPQVRIAQERMLAEKYSFAGPDYDKGLQKEDRYDGIHLAKSGLEKAALLWAEALDEKFFSTAEPWIPE